MNKNKLRYNRIPAEFEFEINVGAGLIVISGKIAEDGQVKWCSSYNQRVETWEEIENLRDQLNELLEKRPKKIEKKWNPETEKWENLKSKINK